MLIANCKIFETAEHSGTAGYGSTAIRVSSVLITNTISRVTIFNNHIWKAAEASVYGKAPGGIIVGGNWTNNSWVEPVIIFNRIYNHGQDFLATHIGGIDLYENTTNALLWANVLESNQYTPIKAQNTKNPLIIGNIINGVHADLTEAAGGAGILLNIDRIALGDWYGGGIVSDNLITISGP